MRWIVAIVIVALTAGVAQAEEPETPLGIAHYEAGKRLYDQKHYPQALVEFSAGYELTRRPAFLINIAQCHRQMHETREAIAYYRQYLAADATSADAAAVRRVVAELEAELPEVPAEPALMTPGAPPLVATTPPPPPRRRHALLWAGVASTGALVVIGGALEIATRLRWDADLGGCAKSPMGCSAAERDGFVLQERAGGGVLIAAGVVGVATIVAAIVEARRR
jgi:hypothetical protein